ncbi:MAG: PorT family protein [Lewinellaceae bacterium]|nr:PorT family protein [Lewinellaceae bacterium]
MKKLFQALWVALLFLFLMPQPLEAQRHRRRHQQRFKAGLILGGNLSQVDGDRYSGFDKANLQFGVSGAAVLSDHAELAVEFLYAGRGSRTESDKNNALGEKDRRIDLRYMEVPILFRYRKKPEEPSSFFELGFSFGRIIRSQVTEPSLPADGFIFRELETDFNKNELTLLGSYGLQASRHLKFKFRFGFAMTQFYDNPAPKEERPPGSIFLGNAEERISFLRNYYMALMAHYQF